MGPLLPGGAPMGSATEVAGLNAVSLGQWDAVSCNTKRVQTTLWCSEVRENSGEAVPCCSPFMSAVPRGAARAAEASLSSTQLSDHVIQRCGESRASAWSMSPFSALQGRGSAAAGKVQLFHSCGASTQGAESAAFTPRCALLSSSTGLGLLTPPSCRKGGYCSFSRCTSRLDLKKSLRSRR